MRFAAPVLSVLVLASLTSGGAQAQTGYDVVQACIDNGGSPATCRGLHQTLRIPGGACRDIASNDPACTTIDGVSVSEAMVARHERSWLARALRHQRVLDDDRPLHNELWTHTHNSFNADAYPPTFYGLDRNQVYSITDQLRMGIRSIEIDVHWSLHPTGAPENTFNSVVACHGGLGSAPHLGCGVNDPLLSERLTEIAAWLEANPGEVILLYLENNLDADPTAHAIAVGMLDEAFGDLVYKPNTRCAPLPMDSTRAEIRQTGKRVVLTGNCGPGSWGNLVHERGPRWNERGIGYGDDFPSHPCSVERSAANYDRNLVRRYGDETGLSAGAQAGGDVTKADARNMIRCGVDMPGLDNLVPFDERLEQFVWSWARNEPRRSATGACAVQSRAGRFESARCGAMSAPVACLSGSTWAVTQGRATFAEADAACAAEGLGRFSVPRSGWENELLRAAKPRGVAKVLLNYRVVGGAWIPG